MTGRGTRMDGANRFKLGLFGCNCEGGLTMTKAPERWDASWDNNLTAARMADAAGLEFMLPVARWHGYRGETDTEGTSFETLTWAAGLLAATQGICAFGTVHVALIHPIFAAKQIVTADHVGRGRFGLNVVSGWNEGEYAMFGATLLEHDERYAYTEEWLEVARRVWSDTEPFDFIGRYFQLKHVLGKPKPYGGGRPMLMSAGSSKAGRAFATRNADCLFMVIVSYDGLADELAALRTQAAPRQVPVYASGHLIARPTQREAEDYHHYIVHEMGDWEAADYMAEIRGKGGQSIPPEVLPKIKERLISGTGTFPVIGSYDFVAERFKALSDAGLEGMAIGLVNYVRDMPWLEQEVLPRMARRGVRAQPPYLCINPKGPKESPSAIVANDAGKLFLDGGAVAFRHVSVAVREQEILCVVGPSGCGKTTLLRCIAGLAELSDGEILVHGHRVSGPPDGVAMVFQHFGLMPWKTVFENAAFGLAVAGAPAAEIRERVEHYLGLVGLAGFERHYPYQLSGGMQQRVGLVRALAIDPSILLMDEPFAALDAQTREILQEELLRLMEGNEGRKTVVFVTHSIDEALVLGDRVAVMSERPGRIREVLESPFARPRDIDGIRADPRFAELRAHLRHRLGAGRREKAEASA